MPIRFCREGSLMVQAHQAPNHTNGPEDSNHCKVTDGSAGGSKKYFQGLDLTVDLLCTSINDTFEDACAL